ncbi:MAG TPA: ABC transporter substrate-binding protein [Tepidisphaeraceae bacterium]|jgi:NitT/TauT family transport system substrate-binding protein
MLRTLVTAIVLIINLPAAAQLTLQLNWKPEPQFGGFYAAEQIGAFKKRGVDVRVEPGGAGLPVVQMVGTGRVAYGIVSADELVIARSRGIDVVALLAVYQTNPQGIMTRADRGITQLADLFAQPGVLAMQKGLPYALYLEKKYGFGKLEIVPSPFGDLTAYRRRKDYAMQCFVTSEPLNAAKTGVEPRTFLIADSGYNPYTTVLVTRGDHLRASPDEVRHVTDAAREGWTAYLADPKSFNDAMRKLNPSMDEQTYAASAAAQKPLIETDQTKANGIGSMTADRWAELIAQLRDLGLIKSEVKAAECFTAAK